ncbi:MAG TPA: ceramidase domain-containing protein [Gammaproteobacteria bacterium]|nr:ceramidase domain-containing protein [Gammaproteobacteria bacterium]
MNYCEEWLASGGFEPWNAVTNLGFVLAAAWGWREFRRAGLMDRAAALALVALAFAIGAGSYAWHATGAAWAQWADVLPILCFVLIFLATALRWLCGWSIAAGIGACVVVLAAAVAATLAYARALNGSIAYVPVWLGLAGLTALLRQQRSPARPAFALATLLFAVSLVFRTLDLALCEATQHRGTHWLWHLCNSALLALLMQTLARHAPSRAPAATIRP